MQRSFNKLHTGCDGFVQMNRRRMMQGVASSAGGLWMTRFAEQLARASESKKSREKSLLMIWLQGGPSQLETFDPHPGTKIGGDTRAISTSIKNVQIADTMPATAEQLKHVSLVRSVVSKEGDHERATYHLKTGWRPDPTVIHPSIGSIVCYKSEGNLEIPRHVSIVPGQWPARAGYLGPKYDAFQIGDPAKPISNLTRRVPEDQMQQRVGPLLDTLETEFQRGRLAKLDENRTLHRTATKNALTMMNSDQLSAFEVTQESKTTLKQFGDNAFGRGCLAAIRLLKTGVRCVEVELGGWDTHINNHELQSSKAQVLDRALAATLSELVSRDMFDDTIVFCGGEFGRTPSINPAGGRDHWPHGFSTLLAGGNFRRGYVHGSTSANPPKEVLNRDDGKPMDTTKLTADVVSVPDLHATLLGGLGINFADEMMTPIGRPLRWSDGNAVKQLMTS